MATWLILVGMALLALAVHPFVSFPASLVLLKRWRPRRPVAGVRPTTAALCVCAYNEERVIRSKALNMLALRRVFPGLSLFVYVDAGTDRTWDILQEFAGDIHLVRAAARTGKTAGMNVLSGLARAECLVFSDANVMMEEASVTRLLGHFADPGVGVVCGHLRYRAEAGNATAAVGSLYWRLEEAIKRLESATGSVMGADGSIFAVRRALYRPAPPDLIDDMYVSLMALCEGFRIVRAEDAIAWEDQVSRPGEEFRRKIRIACQAFNVHRVLWPRLRRLPALDLYKYVSHKLLRWFAGFTLVAGGACVAGGLALLQASWLLGVVILGSLAAVLLPQTRSMLLAFAGTGLGVIRSLRGERFQTWNPPASSRSMPPAGQPGFSRAEPEVLG